MKRALIRKKILAVSMCAAMALQGIQAVAFAGYSPDDKRFTEDFSDSSLSAANWTKTYGNAMPAGFDATFQLTDGFLRLNRKDGDWGKTSYDEVSNAVRSANYRLSAASLPDEMPQSISGKFRWSQYVTSMKIGYYEHQGVSRAFTFMSEKGNSVVQKRENGTVAATDSFVHTMALNTWYRFAMTFTLQGDGTYQAALQLEDGTGTPIYNSVTATGLTAAKACLTFYGSMDPLDFDDIIVSYPASASTEVERFQAEFQEILSKSLTDITIEQLDSVQAALSAFNALNELSQAQLVIEKALLDSMAEKLEILKGNRFFDDFEDPAKTARLWKKEYGIEMLGGFDAVFSNEAGALYTNRKEGDWTAAGGYDKVAQAIRAATLSVNPDYLPNAIPSVISGKFKLSQYVNNVEFTYYRDTDGTAHSVNLLLQSGAAYVQNRVGGEVKVTNPADAMVQKEAWYQFELLFIRRNSGNYDVTFRITDGQGSIVYNQAASTSLQAQPACLSINGSMDPVYYDDISITMTAADDESAANKQNTAFRNQYRSQLRLQKATVSTLDEQAIEEAISEFNSLSPLAQTYLADAIAKLQTLKGYCEELRAQGIDDSGLKRQPDDYAPFEEDFESHLRRFVDDGSQDALLSLAEDSERAGKVLEMKNGASLIKPKSDTLPHKARITDVRFQMKLQYGSFDIWSAARLYISYTDFNNWTALDIFCNVKDGDFFYRVGVKSDGSYSAGAPDILPIDFTKWTAVEIKYGLNSKCSVTFAQEEKSAAFSVTLKDIRGGFALGSAGLDGNFNARSVYYDDFVMEMEPGDWDEDDEINDIVVYYKGNTAYQPGDTAMLIGENLYDTVSGVSIMRLSGSGLGQGYIKEALSDTSVTSGPYSSPVSPSWDDAKATPCALLQTTNDSIKFQIPPQLEKGVYAVKLTQESGGSTVLYLNNPQIDYTMADEGGVATQGGWVRAIGKNLVLDGKDACGMRMTLRDSSGRQYELDRIEAQSVYSLTGKVPADVPKGDYEVWVYNGYGDGTAWSVPGTITVGDSPRDSFPSTIFNVRDFGATGTRDQNATPYVVKALTAISENGGGVLYFPKGIYNLIHSLIIPENVTIRGESVEEAIVFWSPDQWKWDELPKYMLGVTRNMAMEDISFYGTRIGSFYKTFGERCDNLYISNVRVHISPYAGNITEGNLSAATTGRLTPNEMYAMARAESSRTICFQWDNASNVQVDNLLLDNYGSARDYVGKIRYLNMSDCQSIGEWSAMELRQSAWENCTFSGMTLGFTGDDVYAAHNTMKDMERNNRELFVADGGPTLSDGIIRALPEKGADTYAFQNAVFKQNALKGFQIYIVSGQGAGQTRMITQNTSGEFTVDNPFVIPPNRNSRIMVRHIRSDMYFVDNVYYNGAAGGFFGGFSDVVYDGNQHERHGDFYFWAREADYNWYLSVINDTFSDPYYLHNYGAAWHEDYSGFTRLWVNADQYKENSSRGMIFKDNSMDGYMMEFRAISANAIRDIVIEKNLFANVDKGVSFKTGLSDNAVDGMLITGNTFENVQNPCFSDAKQSDGTPQYLVYTRTPNQTGSSRLLMPQAQEAPALQTGDVNGDGAITLKDASLIRYTLLGQAALTPQQTQRADVNGDGAVTLKDAAFIRSYVLGTIRQFPQP